MITRLALYGGARGLYGSFAGKTPGAGTTILDFKRGYMRGGLRGRRL